MAEPVADDLGSELVVEGVVLESPVVVAVRLAACFWVGPAGKSRVAGFAVILGRHGAHFEFAVVAHGVAVAASVAARCFSSQIRQPLIAGK